MKRTAGFILAAVFAATLSFCGGDDNKGTGSESATGVPVKVCHQYCEAQEGTRQLGCTPKEDLATCKAGCDQAAADTPTSCAEAFDNYYACQGAMALFCGETTSLGDDSGCDTESAQLDDCKKSAGGEGGSGGAGKGGSGGSGGSAEPELTIDDLPTAWQRPDDCGGIGEMCGDCGDNAICQLMDDSCVPARASELSGSDATDEPTPYCMSYVCMTYEEASCFCTGPAGRDREQCVSPASAAGLCAQETRSCVEDPCCGELTCLQWEPGKANCYKTCADNDECESGCCTDLRDTGTLVCASAQACEDPCLKLGETCTSSGECCRGACRTESDFPQWNGCRPECKSNADCPTGCCVLTRNPNNGFCADAEWCATCSAPGGECTDDRQCCGDNDCLRDTGVDYWDGCRPPCRTNSDCESGCCELYADADHGFCADAEWCVCGTQGVACGSALAPCCEGLVCSGDSDTGVFDCGKICYDDSECDTRCCIPITGTDYGTCDEASRCGF